MHSNYTSDRNRRFNCHLDVDLKLSLCVTTDWHKFRISYIHYIVTQLTPNVARSILGHHIPRTKSKFRRCERDN